VPASSRRVWQALEDALIAAEDPRVVDAAMPPGVDRDRVRAGIVEPRLLDDAERSALRDVAKIVHEDALRAAGARERDAALRSAIYASPTDDEPRAVYAEWLSTLGDPRGELIKAQLARASCEPSRKELARERALVSEHGRAWLGAAGRFITTGGARFERGFLAAARLERHVAGELSDDVWRTCVELDFSEVAADDARIVALLDSDALTVLERVVGARIGVFQRLASDSGRPRLDALRARLRALGASGPLDDLTALDAALRAFPRVEELVWFAWGDPARLLRHVLEGGLFARLRRVDHSWAASSKSEKVHRLSLERTEAGPALSVALGGLDAVGIHVAATLVAEVVDAIGARLARLVVDVDPKVNASVLAPLERAAARFRLGLR
jgi:uncharacterized protein (TIGR02996 family)